MKQGRSFAVVPLALSLALVVGCGFKDGYDSGVNIRTMIELQFAATALEEYRNAHGVYPAAASVDELRAALSRNRLLSWDGTDRWGEPILVDVDEGGYRLSSKGDDREGGHEFGGAVTTKGHSITLENGRFVQYWAGVERVARDIEAEIAAVRDTGETTVAETEVEE